ncbi:hypothetical protein BC833DRAFT_611484 [Globomyces pollinis-pini]|nr:hypothetical protein BC833DRAFT_611484 [Globomyces pollinis-pini]
MILLVTKEEGKSSPCKILKNIEKNVWRDSLNIPIMEYEDLTLDLIQKEPFNEMITIHQRKLDPNFFNESTLDHCDLLVFADGSSSIAFNNPGIHKCSFGHSDYALGVPYHVDQPNSPEEATFLQNLNVAMTVGQTRYLMNSLRSERGYLNIRLNSTEFDLINQGDTLDDIEKRAIGNEKLQCLQRVILDGLALFGIDQKDTKPIDKFQIQMHYASCRYYQSGHYARVPTCLIGNAAMSVHFWPGRGANSGIKSAYALAHEVERCSSSTSRPYFQASSSNSLSKFESYMAELMSREQCGRSGIIAEVKLPITNRLFEVFTAERKELIQRIVEKAEYFGFDGIKEEHIIDRLQDVSKPSLYTMCKSGAWPPMGSCDSNPRSYFEHSTSPSQSSSFEQSDQATSSNPENTQINLAPLVERKHILDELKATPAKLNQILKLNVGNRVPVTSLATEGDEEKGSPVVRNISNSFSITRKDSWANKPNKWTTIYLPIAIEEYGVFDLKISYIRMIPLTETKLSLPGGLILRSNYDGTLNYQWYDQNGHFQTIGTTNIEINSTFHNIRLLFDRNGVYIFEDDRFVGCGQRYNDLESCIYWQIYSEQSDLEVQMVDFYYYPALLVPTGL